MNKGVEHGPYLNAQDRLDVFESLAPQPLAQLTIVESGRSPIVRALTERDLHSNDLRIYVYETREQGGLAVALRLLRTLSMYSALPTNSILLAADSTHLSVYSQIIKHAQAFEVDLKDIDWGHLDNYAYPSSTYPQGPDEYDFVAHLRRHFIDPAGIPNDHFHPIQSWGTDNLHQVARDYDDWVRSAQPIIGLFGLGPVTPPIMKSSTTPDEVHLAYITAQTPLYVGYHYLPELSPATIFRNHKMRHEHSPTGGITMGPRNIQNLQYKFVSAWGKPQEVAAAFLGPINLGTVATMLRRYNFRPGTHVFLDRASAQPLLDRVQQK